MAKRKYFVCKKYMGDDMYSWAVFPKGSNKPRVTGCGRSEADYYADRFEKEEIEKREAAKQKA